MSEQRQATTGSFRRLLRNLRHVEEGIENAKRINNALAYCDRILAHNPNGAQLMFLGEVKRILTGESDGRPIAEGTDG